MCPRFTRNFPGNLWLGHWYWAQVPINTDTLTTDLSQDGPPRGQVCISSLYLLLDETLPSISIEIAKCLNTQYTQLIDSHIYATWIHEDNGYTVPGCVTCRQYSWRNLWRWLRLVPNRYANGEDFCGAFSNLDNIPSYQEQWRTNAIANSMVWKSLGERSHSLHQFQWQRIWWEVTRTFAVYSLCLLTSLTKSLQA